MHNVSEATCPPIPDPPPNMAYRRYQIEGTSVQDVQDFQGLQALQCGWPIQGPQGYFE